MTLKDEEVKTNTILHTLAASDLEVRDAAMDNYILRNTTHAMND
jgi:hypothetical protein